MLEGDQDINNLQVKLEYLSTMIYFLESVLRQLQSRDYQISTAVKWKMFLAGV